MSAGNLYPGANPEVFRQGLLEGAEVHLWLFDLEKDWPSLRCAEGCLSASERQRAAAYRHERDARWFLARRVALRLLLAGYLAVLPESLCFETGPFGKPGVKDLANGCDPQFSLAHRDGVGVLAFTSGAALGVDVERDIVLPDVLHLAKTQMNAIDFEQTAASDARDRSRIFLEYWTRKEALLKATGVGLTGQGVNGGEFAKLTTLPDQHRRNRLWSSRNLTSGNFILALANEGKARASRWMRTLFNVRE